MDRVSFTPLDDTIGEAKCLRAVDIYFVGEERCDQIAGRTGNRWLSGMN